MCVSIFSLPAELRTSLEEHQSAIELIMTKYREQVFRLLMASKKDDPAIVTQLKEQHTTVSDPPSSCVTSYSGATLSSCIEEVQSKYLYCFYSMTLQEMQAHIDKINEMATVMRKAIEVDEGRLCEDEERIKQLEVSHTGWLYSRSLLKALTEY